MNRINTIIIVNKLFIFTKSFHIYNKLLELIENRKVRSKEEEWCLDMPSPMETNQVSKEEDGRMVLGNAKPHGDQRGVQRNDVHVQ